MKRIFVKPPAFSEMTRFISRSEAFLCQQFLDKLSDNLQNVFQCNYWLRCLCDVVTSSMQKIVNRCAEWSDFKSVAYVQLVISHVVMFLHATSQFCRSRVTIFVCAIFSFFGLA